MLFHILQGFQKSTTIKERSHWNHVCTGFCSSQTQQQVISLISSSPLTEGVLISVIKRCSVCYRHMALDGTQFVLPTYLHLTFDLMTYCLSVLPSVYLFLTHCCPPSAVILTSLHLLQFSSPASLLRPLVIPHAEVYPLSSYVNNTWPLRLWIGRENKIYGLGCFSVCLPHGTLTLAASVQLLGRILSDLS